MAESDVPDKNDFTEHYNTELSPPEQDSFNGWMKDQSAKAGRDVSKDLYDYDLQGYWQKNAGDTEEGPQLSGGHLTDEFKKPNHPTFSDQSKYHGVAGNEGGSWEQLPGGESGVQAWSFKPGATNLEHREPAELQDYWDRVEAPAGNTLKLPPTPDHGAPGQIDRSRIRSELEQNPALADRLNQMVRGEVGDHASPEVRRIQMETAMNRALARGHSLDQALWDTAGHGNAGYYPHQSFTRGGFDKDTFGGDLEAVLSGSNYAGKYGKGLITGNASADVARHQFARGTPGFTVETGSGPESYFSEGPFKNEVLAAGGFMPEGAQLSRQGLAQMPVTFPGRMSVPSDTSNFPPSSNIDDRRQPGPIQRSKDAINDAYLATRAMLGMGPMPPRYANVKNPDDRLGSVKDIRDRVDVIRERHQKENELFDQAHVDYKADSDAYFAEREANEAAVSKYHTDLDSYLTDLMKAATKGQQAKFVKQRGPVPPPPADMTRKHPDPEQYFGETARYKIYNKLNPE